jgi:hypothetical protein
VLLSFALGFAFAAPILVVLFLGRRNALDAPSEVVHRGLKRFLQGSGHSPRVDRGDRLLLQRLDERQRRTVITGLEGICNCVAALRELGCDGAGKLRLRGDAAFRATPATG